MPEGWKVTTLLASSINVSPVWGLRPFLDFLSFTLNFPKPLYLLDLKSSYYFGLLFLRLLLLSFLNDFFFDFKYRNTNVPKNIEMIRIAVSIFNIIFILFYCLFYFSDVKLSQKRIRTRPNSTNQQDAACLGLGLAIPVPSATIRISSGCSPSVPG